ncbi:hypothetical protein D3C76_1307810 [compost metagenome]
MCCTRHYRAYSSMTVLCWNCAQRWRWPLSRTLRTVSCNYSIWRMLWQSTIRPRLLKKHTTGCRRLRRSVRICGQNYCASSYREQWTRPRHLHPPCVKWQSSIARYGCPPIRRECRRYNAWLAHESAPLSTWPNCPRHWPTWTLRSSTMHNATSSR